MPNKPIYMYGGGFKRLPSLEEIWNEALVITGQWKPKQRCDAHRQRDYPNACKYGFEWSYGPHDIPPPPVGDPVAFDKMLDWAIANSDGVDFFKNQDSSILCELEPRTEATAPTKAIALATAIVALKASEPGSNKENQK